MRIVLDTNVLLAAFGTRGLCEALVAACLESHDLVTSDHILAELREHLVKAFRLTGERADGRRFERFCAVRAERPGGIGAERHGKRAVA